MYTVKISYESKLQYYLVLFCLCIYFYWRYLYFYTLSSYYRGFSHFNLNYPFINSYIGSLVVINLFNFCLSENVLISPSIFNGQFCQIYLLDDIFFFLYFAYTVSLLLISKTSDEKLAGHFIEDFLYIKSDFFLAVFRILFVFWNVDYIVSFLSVSFFGFLYLEFIEFPRFEDSYFW